MKFARCILPSLAALVLPLSAASAGSLTLSGDTTGAPVFNRPTITGELSFQTVPYQAYAFTVSAVGVYDFTVSAVNPDLFDTFLHLYRNSFNPAVPDQNFLAANDDATSMTTNSALSGVNLSTGNTYFLVADGLTKPGTTALFTAAINGPGNIVASPVPEPSSFLLGAVVLGVGSVGAFVRRRAAAAC